MTVAESISDASLAQRAYDELHGQILTMQLMPGQAILVQDLATQLGMSRTPIREAVARLRQEGLVTTVMRKGIVVTWLSPEEMRELYELMEGVEGTAVKLATERASEAMLDTLEASIVDQERALLNDDIQAWVAADARLHDLIIEAAENKRIAAWARTVNSQMHRVRVFIARLRRKPNTSTAEHRAILDAMRARDPERARDLHMAHRARASKEIIHILREYVSPPIRATENHRTAHIGRESS